MMERHKTPILRRAADSTALQRYPTGEGISSEDSCDNVGPLADKLRYLRQLNVTAD